MLSNGHLPCASEKGRALFSATLPEELTLERRGTGDLSVVQRTKNVYECACVHTHTSEQTSTGNLKICWIRRPFYYTIAFSFSWSLKLSQNTDFSKLQEATSLPFRLLWAWRLSWEWGWGWGWGGLEECALPWYTTVECPNLTPSSQRESAMWGSQRNKLWNG